MSMPPTKPSLPVLLTIAAIANHVAAFMLPEEHGLDVGQIDHRQ